MSVWLLVAIGCTFSDYTFKELKYCNYQTSGIFKTKAECILKKMQSDRCIEFKKGEYLLQFEDNIRRKLR